MKKIGIYDPYLNILGGGERYILTMAEHFSQKAAVEILWNEDIKRKILSRLNINLERVNFVYKPENLFKRVNLLHKYDLFIYMTDGSLFWSPAKENVLIIQSPAHLPLVANFYQRAKLNIWNPILCYSQFVGKYIKKKLKRKPTILPPPVEVDVFRAKKKENIILSTGRFFSHLHSKKQDFLVDVFLKLYQQGKVKNWKLVLIGSVVDKDAQAYLEKIKTKAKGFPIEIVANAPFSVIKGYYAKAKIFWLATGFGEDLQRFPEKAEHFGIVTLEAMAAECVPIVFAGGGQPEIIDHGRDGYLFAKEKELLLFTQKLIADESQRRKMAKLARKKSCQFSRQFFIRRVDELFKI